MGKEVFMQIIVTALMLSIEKVAMRPRCIAQMLHALANKESNARHVWAPFRDILHIFTTWATKAAKGVIYVRLCVLIQR